MISIAMTAFNTEKFVVEALESITKQTYKDWELVFVDDGSKDKTLELVKNFVKKNHIIRKTRIFHHGKNYGYGTALKNSIEYGTGELVAIVDSDDILFDDRALEIMVNYHEKYPEASLIYSNFYEFHTDIKRKSKRLCSDIPKNKTFLGDFRGNTYIGNNFIISHLKVFKRSYYDMTEGVDYQLLKAVDKDIILKLEEVGNLVHVPEFLYAHRTHKNNISTSYNQKSNELKKIITDLKNQMYVNAKKRRGL